MPDSNYNLSDSLPLSPSVKLTHTQQTRGGSGSEKIMTFLCERRMAVQCNFSLGKWTCEKREGKRGKVDVKDSVLSGFVLLM